MEFGALWESYLLDGDPRFARWAGESEAIYLSIALDYAHGGLWDEALQLLSAVTTGNPLRLYYCGWILQRAGRREEAQAAFAAAAAEPVDRCFPNRLDDVLVLEAAMRAAPHDSHAPYLLGVFWYAHRQYDEAITLWEKARDLDPDFATVHRNLGLALFNKRHNPQAALEAYERAFALDPGDARVFFELDQLYKRLNHDPSERLARLETHLDLVKGRDDLTIEHIGLLNLLGRHDEAYALLMGRNFHPWEGGEGKATAQYVAALVAKAKAHLAEGSSDAARAAIACLEGAQVYPPNLGEGKLHGAQENHIFYYLGGALAALGEHQRAQEAWQRAASGLSEPTSAMYYNDQPPDMIFYQGLARRALDREQEAQEIFHRLVAYGEAHLDDDVQMDYFAVSLPDFLVFDDDLATRNRIHCHYMMGLGHLGLGEQAKAIEHFDAVLSLRADHLGAHIHKQMARSTQTNHPAHGADPSAAPTTQPTAQQKAMKQ
jgi:tetratricopeptide (TPR) repeat protein